MNLLIHPFRLPQRRSGFSLVEILTVIGILVLLISITAAIVTRAQRKADVVRQKADFQSISMALEQFKADHGHYPGQNDPPGRSPLGRFLMGPGNANTASPPFDIKGFHTDWADGMGFRFNNGTKLWPPYLNTEKFKVQSSFGLDGIKGTNDDTGRTDILDVWGYPILYYPKRKQFAVAIGPLVSDRDPYGIYDIRDGWFVNTDGVTPRTPNAGPPFPVPLSARTLRAVLGDLNNNNAPDEQLTFSGDFILASPGADHAFTDLSSEKLESSDDIFNFDR